MKSFAECRQVNRRTDVITVNVENDRSLGLDVGQTDFQTNKMINGGHNTSRKRERGRQRRPWGASSASENTTHLFASNEVSDDA